MNNDGLPHLRKLGVKRCWITDDDIESIMQALMEGNHHNLLMKDMNFGYNCITPRGLVALCRLDPSTFPRLSRLNLKWNHKMLDDVQIVQRFVGQVLLARNGSTTPTLTELRIPYCSTRAEGYALIIQPLETNRTLLLLHMQLMVPLRISNPYAIS
jgi:hypothetical protein